MLERQHVPHGAGVYKLQELALAKKDRAALHPHSDCLDRPRQALVVAASLVLGAANSTNAPVFTCRLQLPLRCKQPAEAQHLSTAAFVELVRPLHALRLCGNHELRADCLHRAPAASTTCSDPAGRLASRRWRRTDSSRAPSPCPETRECPTKLLPLCSVSKDRSGPSDADTTFRSGLCTQHVGCGRQRS